MKAKPTTLEVQDEMSKLAQGGIGSFESLTDKEKVFYKPLPKEANKGLLLPLVNFEEYNTDFMKERAQTRTSSLVNTD